MSTRKRPGADSPATSSGVKWTTCASSSTVFNRWPNCQRQSFHDSGGTSSHGWGGLLRPGGSSNSTFSSSIFVISYLCILRIVPHVSGGPLWLKKTPLTPLAREGPSMPIVVRGATPLAAPLPSTPRHIPVRYPQPRRAPSPAPAAPRRSPPGRPHNWGSPAIPLSRPVQADLNPAIDTHCRFHRLPPALHSTRFLPKAPDNHLPTPSRAQSPAERRAARCGDLRQLHQPLGRCEEVGCYSQPRRRALRAERRRRRCAGR